MRHIFSLAIFLVIAPFSFSQSNCDFERESLANSSSGLHFLNDQTGFSVEGNVLLRTNDGGYSWYKLDCVSTRGFARFHFPIGQLNTGYLIGSEQGMYKTSDGGLHWTQLCPPQATGYLGLHFFSPDTGWVIFDPGIIWQTHDGGLNWQESSIHQQLPTIGSMQILNDSLIYYGAGGDLIIRQSGSLFDTLSNPNQDDLIGYWFEDANKGFSFSKRFNQRKIHQTIDGGLNWTTSSIPGLSSFSASSVDSIWLSANQRLYLSTDGGQTWPQSSTQPYFNSYTNLMFFWNTQRGFVASSGSFNGGRMMASTTDMGNSWDIQSNLRDDEINDTHFVNDSIAYMITENALIFKSTDGGRTWRKAFEHDQNPPVSFANTGENIHFFDETNGVAFTRELLLQTQDGGASWSKQLLDLGNAAFDGVQYLNDSTWFLNRKGLITRDAGTTWDTLLNLVPPTFGGAYYYYMGGDTAFYAYVENIYKTTDKGQNWQAMTINANPGLNVFVYKVHFFDDTNGYATGADGLFLRTNDGGLNWQQIQNAVSTDLQIANFLNPDLGYATRRNGFFVYKITQQGQQWDQYSGNYPNIRSIEIKSDSLTYIAGEDAHILRLGAYRKPCIPSLISGPVTACLGDNDYYVISSGQDYLWEISSGGIVNPSGHETTIAWLDTGWHTVFVRVTDGCDTSEVRQLPVYVESTVIPQITVINDSTLATDLSNNIQWYRNGQAIPGANGDTLIISEGGSYRVQFENSCGQSSSETALLTLSAFDPKASAFQLFPNPASQQLFLRSSGHTGKVHWRVNNLLGQSVLEGTSDQSIIELPIAQLAPGTYSVQVQLEHRIWHQRFLKK